MKIAVISDTHDRLPTLERALRMFRRIGVDMVLHAGDYVAPFAAKLLVDPQIAPDPRSVPLHCIYGNNDGERVGLKNLLPGITDGPMRINAGGRVIAMHHWVEWFKPGETDRADIIITGHTHQVVNEKRNDVLHLNPGECCGWLTGRCTVALLNTQDLSAQIIDVHD